MKKDIHPEYHTITVEMTDGSKYQTRTTWGKPDQVMKLEIDPIAHPAWHEGMKTTVLERGQLNKFQNRFGGISASSALTKKAPAAKAAAKTETPDASTDESAA